MASLSAGGSPPGLLRLLVVFHESEALGAGRSVLQALDPLGRYGWTPSGWFPGDGPLLEEAAASIPTRAYRRKPIRYSVRGWRAEPGVVARLRETPSYLRAFRQMLLHARPHVVHANTLRTLPEARVARKLGLPVVVHVHELPPPGAKRTLTLRTAAKTADVLVVVSEAVARVVRPKAGDTPILVAYNGVATPPRQNGLHVANGRHDRNRVSNQRDRRLPRGCRARARTPSRAPLRAHRPDRPRRRRRVRAACRGARRVREHARPPASRGRARSLGALRARLPPGRVPAREPRGDGGRSASNRQRRRRAPRADRAPRERRARRTRQPERSRRLGRPSARRPRSCGSGSAKRLRSAFESTSRSKGRPRSCTSRTWPR